MHLLTNLKTNRQAIHLRFYFQADILWHGL